jgi:cytochrome c-type biogenesis protein CcmH/NrfG
MNNQINVGGDKMVNAIKINGMLRIASFVVAMVILVACSSPDDQQMVQTARDYLGNRNVQEAALELRNALQQNPDNAEARYLLGQINLDIGDFASAEKEFRRAREAGWHEEEAQIGLARALISTNRFQDLVDEVEIKDSYAPTARANLYGLRAAAAAGLGDVEQAREMLATGADLDPDAIQLLKITIQIQLATGELEAATTTLTQALSVHPDDPEILLLSATMAIQGNDHAGAMEACQKSHRAGTCQADDRLWSASPAGTGASGNNGQKSRSGPIRTGTPFQDECR